MMKIIRSEKHPRCPRNNEEQSNLNEVSERTKLLSAKSARPTKSRRCRNQAGFHFLFLAEVFYRGGPATISSEVFGNVIPWSWH
jgi:hypothetical protein